MTTEYPFIAALREQFPTDGHKYCSVVMMRSDGASDRVKTAVTNSMDGEPLADFWKRVQADVDAQNNTEPGWTLVGVVSYDVVEGDKGVGFPCTVAGLGSDEMADLTMHVFQKMMQSRGLHGGVFFPESSVVN